MSNPNPERSERPERVWITWDDAYPWPTAESGGDEYVRVQLLNDAATRMRNRCVQKLTELIDAAQKKHPSAHVAVRRMALHDAITALQSLTLEGERAKQKPVDVCVVCKSEPVCPEDGFDTCTYCARRI